MKYMAGYILVEIVHFAHNTHLANYGSIQNTWRNKSILNWSISQC